MRDLHEELTALSVEWPATPDLAAAVRRGSSRPRPRARAWRPALAYGARGARRGFRAHDGRLARRPLGRARVARPQEREDRAARADRPAAAAGQARLRPRPRHAGDARRGAPQRSPFLRLPQADGLGEPDAIYARRRPRLARLRRAARLRALDDDRRRAAGAGVPGARRAVHREDDRRRGRGSTALRVGGDPAYFITGAHGFAYEDEGEVRFEDQRLAGNTLLVERADGLLIRVEGDLTRERAVAVAQSIE